MPQRFDLIVFDWDGTLMDSTAAIVDAIRLACADLELPVPSREQAAHVIGLGLHDALARAVPDILPHQVPAMVERYRHHYLRQDHALVLFDGVPAMLDELRERAHTLAIATGKSRAGLDRALQATALDGMFAATRCADETFSKPHPAMLLELIERLDAKPERTLMIGDTTHDLLMAANAGTPAVAVAYGAHPHAELVGATCEHVAHSVAELRAWLAAHA